MGDVPRRTPLTRDEFIQAGATSEELATFDAQEAHVAKLRKRFGRDKSGEQLAIQELLSEFVDAKVVYRTPRTTTAKEAPDA